VKDEKTVNMLKVLSMLRMLGEEGKRSARRGTEAREATNSGEPGYDANLLRAVTGNVAPGKAGL
jgi:hypothetical protein